MQLSSPATDRESQKLAEKITSGVIDFFSVIIKQLFPYGPPDLVLARTSFRSPPGS